MVVATNRAATSHQGCEKGISLVVVCCFVVFSKCANHFFIYWVGPLFNCCGLHFSLRSYGPRRCWLPVFGDNVFVLRWCPTFTCVFPFYPKNCFGVDPQEKAKEGKAGSELRVRFPKQWWQNSIQAQPLHPSNLHLQRRFPTLNP